MRGSDKLLEEIDGEPILVRQVRRALATGDEVLVPVSRDHPARAAALDALKNRRLRVIPVDGREGMAVSLRTAAAHCSAMHTEPAGLMVLLADMPELDTPDLNAMTAAFRAAPDAVHRAAGEDGMPGHPVIFPRRLFGRLTALTGDDGAKSVLQVEKVHLHPLPGRRALVDLDTPEDWAAWRAGR